MVAVSGFEPELKGYEPFVLPLHYTAIIFGGKGKNRTYDLLFFRQSLYH